MDLKRLPCGASPWGAEPAKVASAARAFRIWLLAVLAAVLAPAASAQIAGEGAFAANFVGIAEPGVDPIQTSDTEEFGTFSSLMTAMNAAGAGLLHNVTGRCMGWWLSDGDQGTFDEHVHCIYVDEDGDQIFERAEFEDQPHERPAVGTGRWTGGTGKYRELSGVFEIRTRELRPIRSGLVQYVGTKKGNYALPTPKD